MSEKSEIRSLCKDMTREENNAYQCRQIKAKTTQVRSLSTGARPVAALPRNLLRVALNDARQQIRYLGQASSIHQQGSKHPQLLEAWTARLREILARMKELGMS